MIVLFPETYASINYYFIFGKEKLLLKNNSTLFRFCKVYLFSFIPRLKYTSFLSTAMKVNMEQLVNKSYKP